VASFYIENFGCRASQADGAALESQFLENGLERAGAARDAEIVVLNTCTVTDGADKDARASIRRVRRENPGCRILVTGCYAQRAPQELASLPGVSWVVGNSHKHLAAEIATSGNLSNRQFVPLTQLSAGLPSNDIHTTGDVIVGDIFAHTELLAAPVFESSSANSAERTRSNLKVQDGCDNRCSFCVIPSVRGHSRSLQLPEIIREVDALVAAGYREVVISGINLGRWGRDLAVSCQLSAFSAFKDTEHRTPDFESLIRAILGETQLEKLRISSVEPMDWTDDLIALVASSPRIAKHAHVPLQSGSDSVLRRMHRKYRPWHYREKIEEIRAAMPTAAIGADVMTGFPGETDAEFEATRRLIEDLPFTYLHVFTYSPRPGTPAAEMPRQVPVHVARARNRVLRDLAADKKQAFMQSFAGRTVEAITLACGTGPAVREPSHHPFTEALTDNYLPLRLLGKHAPNQWLRARVEALEDGKLVGMSTTASQPLPKA